MELLSGQRSSGSYVFQGHGISSVHAVKFIRNPHPKRGEKMCRRDFSYSWMTNHLSKKYLELVDILENKEEKYWEAKEVVFPRSRRIIINAEQRLEWMYLQGQDLKSVLLNTSW